MLVPTFLVGVTVASAFGSDLYGWLAAALTAVVLLLVRRVRGTRATCAIPPPTADGATAPDQVDTGSARP